MRYGCIHRMTGKRKIGIKRDVFAFAVNMNIIAKTGEDGKNLKYNQNTFSQYYNCHYHPLIQETYHR